MAQAQEGVQAVIETGAGDITVEFLPDKAPRHVANFIKLSKEGFYDGTRFHRVIPGFMVQGGDPNTKTDSRSSWGAGGPGHKIDAEFNDVHHERGVLSMARSADPDSAGSQFFFVHGEAGFLDGQYTVFGRICDGFDALDAIANAPCESGGEGSSPVDPVKLNRVRIVEPTS